MDCKHPLMKKYWRPDWERRNEFPSIGPHQWPIGNREAKYLWGNIPAYDLLQLAQNEGSGHGQDLSLLFAGMYPLRSP